MIGKHLSFNKEGIDTIFSTLQKEYEAEENRNKQLETKGQVLLAVSGILASALMLLFKSVMEAGNNRLDIFLLVAAFALLVSAMLCFLLVYKIEVFQQIAHGNLLSDEALKLDGSAIKFNLAHDYFNCIKHNTTVCNLKIKRIKCGTILIICSMLLIAFVFIHFSIISVNNKRGNAMAKDSTSNSGASKPVSPSTTIPKVERNGDSSSIHKSSNNENKPGFGTQPIERGQSSIKK